MAGNLYNICNEGNFRNKKKNFGKNKKENFGNILYTLIRLLETWSYSYTVIIRNLIL